MTERQCSGIHHISEQAGYVVVRTRMGEGAIEDVATFPNTSAGVCYAYSDALELAWKIRAEGMADGSREYARIDVLYRDGCRGIL